MFLAASLLQSIFKGKKIMKNVLGLEQTWPVLDQSATATATTSEFKSKSPTDKEIASTSP